MPVPGHTQVFRDWFVCQGELEDLGLGTTLFYHWHSLTSSGQVLVQLWHIVIGDTHPRSAGCQSSNSQEYVTEGERWECYCSATYLLMYTYML